MFAVQPEPNAKPQAQAKTAVKLIPRIGLAWSAEPDKTDQKKNARAELIYCHSKIASLLEPMAVSAYRWCTEQMNLKHVRA
jgi:hypothetical protein